MKKPNFFIIGAPKCGTTALASWLSDHPNVFMSPVKEPHYYSRDLKMQQIKSEREYDRLFKGATENHLAIGEASVWYLYSQEAVANIVREIPEARCIVCLRNPVEMAYSLHGQQLVSTNEHIEDFEKAWNAQTQREENKEVSKWCDDLRLLLYGPACSLGDQMTRLFATVSREKVLSIFLDDMKENPSKCLQSVQEFLNVPDDGRIEFPIVNAASQRRSNAMHNVIKAINRVRRQLGVPRLGTRIMKSLSNMNRKPSVRPDLDLHMRRQLVDYFTDDIQKLEQLFGRDLSHWRQVD